MSEVSGVTCVNGGGDSHTKSTSMVEGAADRIQLDCEAFCL